MIHSSLSSSDMDFDNSLADCMQNRRYYYCYNRSFEGYYKVNCCCMHNYYKLAQAEVGRNLKDWMA